MGEKKELRERELKAIAISPEGNYGVYRQLFNIDIPQDITNFRQIQEAINTVEKDVEKQREKFYAKDKIETDNIIKETQGEIKVKDFIPTAGIVRIDTEDGKKLDVLITYPLDKVEEGKNVFLLGKGVEREDMEGELLYDEDLRNKKLSDIKLNKGITLEEFKEAFKQIQEKSLFKDLREELGLNNITVEDLEGDRELANSLLKKMEEKAKEDKEIKEKLEVIGIKEFQLTLTAKEVVDRLIEQKRLEGRVYNTKVQFYPVNGIILGENENKDLVMVFSPQRLDWTVKGIGIANQLNQDLNYKIGNSILTILQSPTTERIIVSGDKADEKEWKELKNKIDAKIEQLRNLEKNFGEKLDDRLFEILSKIKEGIETKEVSYIKKGKELLREWRDRKIMELVDKPKIDIQDILKPHKEKVRDGKEIKYVKTDKKFLRWDLTDLQTPLGFYKKLYDAVKLRGTILKSQNGNKLYFNNVKLLFAKETRIIPDSVRSDKPSFKIENVLKPVAFTKVSFTVKDEGDYRLNSFLLKNKIKDIDAKNLNAFLEFLEKWKKENNISVYLNRADLIVNEKWDKYTTGYVKQLVNTLTTSKIFLEDIIKALNNDNVSKEVLEEKVKKYLDTLGGGVRKNYIGLGKLRERLSNFKQGIIFENFIKHNVENKVKPLANEMVKAIEEENKEKAKEIAEKLKDIYEKGEIGKLMKTYEDANDYNNYVLSKRIESFENAINKINKLTEKMRNKEELTFEEKAIIRQILKNALKNIWLENVKAEGLLKLIKTDMFKQFPEEDKNLIRKELNNKLAMERIANAVMGQMRETMADRIMQTKIRMEEKQQINVDEKIVAKEKEEIEPNIVINLEGIENVKEIQVKRKAKGEEFIAKDKKELEEKISKFIEKLDSKFEGLLKVYQAIENVELSPAYKVKDRGYTWNIRMTVKDVIENEEKEVNYRPQQNIIPSLDSVANNLSRNEAFKTYKELAKELRNKNKQEQKREIKVEEEIKKEEKLKKQKTQNRKPRP